MKYLALIFLYFFSTFNNSFAQTLFEEFTTNIFCNHSPFFLQNIETKINQCKIIYPSFINLNLNPDMNDIHFFIKTYCSIDILSALT
jgi:hypothetical protein